MSKHRLLDAWLLIPSSGRRFHSLSTGFHRSLILERLCRAEALPSFRPLTPSGAPFELRIDEFLNRGCLRVSIALVGFVFVRPGLTFSQTPTILFHIEQQILLNLGVMRS